MIRWFGTHRLDRFRPSGTTTLCCHDYQTLLLNQELDVIIESHLVDDRFWQAYPSRVSNANQPRFHGNHNVSTLHVSMQGLSGAERARR